jgi:multiple sugar transport system ATP-binding protein
MSLRIGLLDIALATMLAATTTGGCGATTTGGSSITGGQAGSPVETDAGAEPAPESGGVTTKDVYYQFVLNCENIETGEIIWSDKGEIRKRVDEAARILDIKELLNRKPKQLSGGQRQRVAMGRAIVRNPKVFLFDEPLSNLDAKLRVQMRTEIKKVHQQVRTTTVYVTHDQVEAMTLADRVVVMNHGIIEQVGSPQQLYHDPETRFVAGFIGSPAMNFIPCRLEEMGGGGINIRLTDSLALPMPSNRASRYRGHASNGRLLLGLRPEHITEAGAHAEPGKEPFDARLDVTEPMGMETLVYFPINGTQVCGRVNPDAGASDGGNLRMAANLNNMHLVDEASGKVI